MKRKLFKLLFCAIFWLFSSAFSLAETTLRPADDVTKASTQSVQTALKEREKLPLDASISRREMAEKAEKAEKPRLGRLAQALRQSGDSDAPFRQKIGYSALFFLGVLVILFDQLKRELWKDVETKSATPPRL